MTTTLLNNRYQVIQVLGAGGFGETFLAEDVHMPSRRRCVIKQLKPVVNNPQTYQMVQQRFEREAATLEYLGEGSEQIPKLYAYFSEKGQFYLVQEWIQGQTLTEMVKAKGVLTETTVTEILLSLLSVLEYVHNKGIIHRDIKPDNIILRSSNNKPVLIDFGAVKETVRVLNSSKYHSQSLIIGTPAYMPTEQAVGRPVYATDIYSLGLTAIYLLTGKHPHELHTNPQTGEIVWQQYASGVSSDLAMVINQAIKPHPAERYTTASKMLYALESIISAPQTPTVATQATQATIALSNGSSVLPQGVSYQKSRILPQSPSTAKSQKRAWILGSLIAGGLITTVGVANIARQPSPQSPTLHSSSPELATSPAPTPSPSQPETTNSASQQESASPLDEPIQTPISSPPPTVPITEAQPQQPVAPLPPPSASREEPQEEEPLTSDETEPEPALDNSSSSENSTPPVIPTPVPQEEPVTSAPSPIASTPPEEESPQENPQENEKIAAGNTTTRTVPGFPTGTSKDTITAALGKPTKASKGLWNTRAYLYQLEPNRIDLGYLFDPRTGILRQTEVAFAPSVEPEVMQTTLQQMLRGNAPSEVQQGLQNVYQRQKREYSFNLGNLEGIIQRNQKDHIYIGVWDADLH
jgi:serine/threonine-protein kinase